jgi:hypothetical protein
MKNTVVLRSPQSKSLDYMIHGRGIYKICYMDYKIEVLSITNACI